jgi:LmbE family N-acetylglucosaminyl deacetylase
LDKDVCLGFTLQGECVYKIREKRMLAIFAHPDDESFAADGTLAKYAHQDVQVVLLCVTRGEAGIPGLVAYQAGAKREIELRQAADKLGIEVYLLVYPDGKLCEIDQRQLVEMIATWIDMVQPQVILTFGPDGVSGHPDHITISHIVTEAYDLTYKKGVLLYIHPSEATELGCGVSVSTSQLGYPSIEVDISDYKINKFQAIQCHASQHPVLPDKPEDGVKEIPCSEFFSIARNARKSSNYPEWFEELDKVRVHEQA